MVALSRRSTGRDDALLELVPVVSAIRVLVAAGVALRPSVVARWSGGPDTPAVRALVRAVSARELVLGAGAGWAWWSGSRLPLWLAAQGTADALDVVGLAAAVRTGRLPPLRGYALAAFALSGAVAEAATIRAARRR